MDVTPFGGKIRRRRIAMPSASQWAAVGAVALALILAAASLARVFARWTGWQLTLTLDTAAAIALIAAVVLRVRDRKRKAYIVALEKLNEAALAIASAPGELQPLLD